MRQFVVSALKPLHAVSVENLAHPGTPDVNFAGGWIELKCLPKATTDSARILLVPHFTLQQRMWLKARALAGERTMVLVQIRSTWILLDGVFAANHLGKVTLEELTGRCLVLWANRPSKPEFLRAVKEMQFATEKMW